MTPIIPSTKLLVVNVHKLQATSCSRYYFWMYVLNMIPKGFNTNFWWGSVLGEGVEVVLATKSIDKAIKAMRVKHEEELKDQLLTPGVSEEVDFQLKMLEIIVTVWAKVRLKYIKSVEITASESKFSVELSQSPIIFTGTLDGEGKADHEDTMFEIKSASSQSLNSEYFAHLQFDKQINGYKAGMLKSGRPSFSTCHYLVFRKPQIQVKKTETPDEFLDRLRADLEARADWYYIHYKHRFGKMATNDVLQDIEGITFDLFSKYSYLTTTQLLDPYNWPRNDRQCFNFGICPYFRLCANCKKYPLYMKAFKQRELRYDLEDRELDKTRALTKSVSKIKREKD